MCSLFSRIPQADIQTSEGHRPRPKITAEQLQDLLPLGVNDVRGIWTSIQYVADFSYWDPLSRTPKVVMEALRRASYGLLVRIIGHWVRGGKMNTELSISATARLKDLQTTSNVADPPTWPKAPPKADRPCSIAEWVEYASTYKIAPESALYKRLIDRITEIPSSPDKNISDNGDNDEDDDSLSDSSLSTHQSMSSIRGGSPLTMHGRTLTIPKLVLIDTSSQIYK